jgi:hypothetical protein
VTTSAALVAARTAGWSDAERRAFAALVAALRPSARHLSDIPDWLDDIAAREGGRPGALLDDPALQAALRARGSAPDRLKRWKEQLRRRRYPRLAAREAAIAELVRGMDLGAALTLAPPPLLEGGTVTIALRARSADELVAALDRLRACVARGDVARLFALLDEA